MKRSVSIILAVCIALVAGCALWVGRQNSLLESGFQAVTPGMSRNEVISLMGKPATETAGCHEGLTWMGQTVTGGPCGVEFRYDAHIKPVYWTVSFDRENRAMAKYEYVSP